MSVISVSEFSSLNFRTDWKLPFQQNVDYIPKFLPSDLLQVQYITFDKTVKTYLRNNNTGLVTELQCLILEEDEDYQCCQLSIDNSGVTEEMCFTLFFARSAEGDILLEGDFIVCTELPGTILLKYTNRRDDKGTIFYGVDPFLFRVEGAFLPSEVSFENDSKDFRDQRYVPEMLSDNVFEKQTLTLGGGFGVPNWVARKINLIFSLSYVFVDGNRMVRSEGSTVEITLIHNDYPLFLYKLVLERGSDISGESATIEFPRVADEKKKIIRQSSDSEFRVYSVAGPDPSQARMIRELEFITELSENYTIEIDDNTSSSSNKVSLNSIIKLFSDHFLSNKNNDIAKGVITFLKGINIGNTDDNYFIDGKGNVNLSNAVFSNFQTNNFLAGPLGAGTGTVNKNEFQTDNLMVRKMMIIMEALVQKMRFQGGVYVLSSATGFKISAIEETTDYYRCYFENDNGKIPNEFVIDDQARIQNYTGENQKYLWSLVINKGINYVDLSKSDKDGDGVPDIGDELVQLGNRTDESRQMAVMISAANGECGIVTYFNINSFDLSGKEGSWFGRHGGKEGASIRGELHFESGKLVKEAVEEAQTSADNAQSSANEADKKAQAAQESARQAQEAATIANAEIADMSSDSVISPVEKPALKEKWDVILSEKTKIDAQAINIGVSPDAYDNAYNALYNLIGNNLNDLTTKWEIDGPTLRSAFTNYYDARTDLLNTIARVTKEKADKAETDAGNAQKRADDAYKLSDEVNSSVDIILTSIIPDMQEQIDGNIMSWDGEQVPTLSNYPANEWTTEEEKDRHIGDTYDYYLTQDDVKVVKRYKFRKVGENYEWTPLADSDAARLEVELRETLGIANSKNSISYGSRPVPPYSIDDIWITTLKSIYVCRVQRAEGSTGLETDWELVNDTQLRLSNMASDGIISREEKPSYRNTLDQIKKEYATYNASETSVSKTALTSAYNNIVSYMTATLKVTEDSDTDITESQRNQFNVYLAAWYSSVTEFTNLIAKEEAGKAVDNLQVGSQNLISKKMMLKWNEKNKDIAVWGQDEDGIYLDVTPKLLFDNFSVSNDILNPIFDLNFKVNTQYVLAIEWKSKTTEATLKEGLIILIRYTDGGKSDRLILTNHTTSKTTVYIVTQPGRTIQKISSSYGYNVHALIYNISLIEGNKPLQGFPVAEEDQTGANNVNLADGTKEFTVTAGTDNWGYHKLYVSKIKPNTVYYVNAGKIQNLAGTPDKYSFVFYNKGITASLCSVLNADKNGGFLITNNDFTEQEGYLLCYAGIGGATSGNSVKFTEVMLVEGFLPAPVWTPSFSEQQNKIDAAKDAAEQAKADIAAMNDDNIFDISEKQTTRTTWENINGVASTEFTGTTGSYYKTKLEGSGLPELSELDTAYTNLRTYLNGILLYANSNTENFVRSEMAAKFTAYYNAEIAVNTAIADKLSKDAVGNIKLGGRNLATKSNNFNAGNGNTGITSVRNEDGSITVTAASGNGHWFTGFYAGNYGQIENSMNEGDDFTISFEMKSEDSTRIPNIYVKEGMGYYPMIGNMSSAFSQVYYTGKWKKANNMQFHLGFNGLAGSFTIKNLKVEKGNKPTAWSPAIEDQDEKIDGLQGQITEHTKTIAQLQAEDDNIRLSVNSVTTKVDETAKKSFGYSWNSGKMMHTDPTFKVGLNGIYIYNNDAAGGTSAVNISRITRLSDSPTNDSEYNIKIATLNDKTAPKLGGFTFRTQSRANAIFITRIVAKIPVGYYLNWASNQTGDNEEYYWTTSNKGTGNWEEYIHVIKCGSTGNFGVTNYFYLDGPKNNYPVEWYLAYASVFDMSEGLSTSDQARQESISYTDKKTFSKYVFDLTPAEYDRNTYYPITMSLPIVPTTRIKLYIDYWSSGNPEWSTHSSKSVSANCTWTSNGNGYGIIPISRIISDFAYEHTDLTPIGDVSQMAFSSNEYVYVRGGAIYRLEITNGVVPVLHTSEFTASKETISLKTSVTAPKTTLEATKETLDAEIVLLKDSITLKVDYTTYNDDKAILENNISQIEVKQGSIEQSVTNIDNRLGLIEGSGLVIEKNFVRIFSQKKELLGEDIVSSIGLTPDSIRIASNKIEISGQTIFKDSNNNVVNIFGNGDNVLTINGGVFNVDKNGKLTATNAVIKGRIEASEGKIGGFTLEDDGLTFGSEKNGFELNPTLFNIKFQESYLGTVTSKIYAEMGTSESYLTKAPFYFYKKSPSDYYIPTMEIVSENAANINSALRTSGCIVSKNAIIEGGYARVNASEYTTLNLWYGTKYEIYNTVSRYMYFPTVDEVKNWVGSLPASIVIDVVAHHSNSADFRMKWGTGKTIYDWNGGSNSEWVMSKGDSCTFLLVYESVSSYYAQIMQRNS